MQYKLLFIFFYLILLNSCSPLIDDYKVVVVSPSEKLEMKLYYQDDFIENYSEDKSVQSNYNNTSYVFDIDNTSVQRFRLDFDNLKQDSVILQSITLSRKNKEVILKGDDLKDFIMFPLSIEAELLNDKSLLLKINNKEDPYLVSKNLNLLW